MTSGCAEEQAGFSRNPRGLGQALRGEGLRECLDQGRLQGGEYDSSDDLLLLQGQEGPLRGCGQQARESAADSSRVSASRTQTEDAATSIETFIDLYLSSFPTEAFQPGLYLIETAKLDRRERSQDKRAARRGAGYSRIGDRARSNGKATSGRRIPRAPPTA